MTPDQRDRGIPDWAQKERAQDLAWVGENLHIFWPVATKKFAEHGRGLLVVDTTILPVPGKGHPIAYFPQEVVETDDDDTIKRLVREYEPECEFVVLLLKAQDHISSYRVQVHLDEPTFIGDYSFSLS